MALQAIVGNVDVGVGSSAAAGGIDARSCDGPIHGGSRVSSALRCRGFTARTVCHFWVLRFMTEPLGSLAPDCCNVNCGYLLF